MFYINLQLPPTHSLFTLILIFAGTVHCTGAKLVIQDRRCQSTGLCHKFFKKLLMYWLQFILYRLYARQLHMLSQEIYQVFNSQYNMII